MLALALAVFGAVLTAELMGDKLLYTVAAIAGRYSLSSVGVGFALACGGKMFCAVALGRIISALPTAIVLVMFGSVFFAEWGDLGQITVASIAARTGAPMVVWVAATAALLTKGALAVTIGFGLRRFLPLRVMHYASVMTCLTMAAIAIREAGR
jgi:putative Ca2+/H+ antiporter (TMEM165/GDT1 family)